MLTLSKIRRDSQPQYYEDESPLKLYMIGLSYTERLPDLGHFEYYGSCHTPREVPPAEVTRVDTKALAVECYRKVLRRYHEELAYCGFFGLACKMIKPNLADFEMDGSYAWCKANDKPGTAGDKDLRRSIALAIDAEEELARERSERKAQEDFEREQRRRERQLLRDEIKAIRDRKEQEKLRQKLVMLEVRAQVQLEREQRKAELTLIKALRSSKKRVPWKIFGEK